MQGRIQDFKLLKKNCDERREARTFLEYFRGRPCNGRSVLAQDLFIYFFTIYSYCVFKIILRLIM